MSGLRKLALGVVAGLLGYLLVLVILGWTLESRVTRRVRGQLEHTLRASDVEVNEVEVGLVRGSVHLRGVTASRSGLGTANLRVDDIEMGLAPLGWALIDDDVRHLEIVGAHLDLSAAGAATLRRSKTMRRLFARRFVVRDSTVTLAVTTLFPSLGRVKLEVEEARAKDVDFHNSMSWLFRTDVLRARLQLPGSVALVVDYKDGTLSVGGGLMGATPIVIPFAWPTPDPSKLELSQILSLVKSLVKELGPELAKRKLESVWDDVVDVF